MNKTPSKVINFQEYKKNKNKHQQLEMDRRELINLIKKVVTTK